MIIERWSKHGTTPANSPTRDPPKRIRRTAVAALAEKSREIAVLDGVVVERRVDRSLRHPDNAWWDGLEQRSGHINDAIMDAIK
jgi:hypothetical protein